LAEGARQSVERTDFSPLTTIADPDFPQKQLSGWLQHQFTLSVDPSEFARFEEPQDAIPMLREKLRDLYRDQEIRLPVQVALNTFMPEHRGSDRDKLVGWVNHRFRANLSVDAVKDVSRRQVEEQLLAVSRAFYPDDAAVKSIEKRVDQALSRVNGHPTGDPQVYGELIQYGNQSLQLGLEPQALSALPKQDVRQAVFRAFEDRFRPEMGQAERAILLDVLDSAWKEHLYLMDHLRQSIGLEGYAGKDPKVEYKRQGMRAFEGMWDRVREHVTFAIFRIEHESPALDNSRWEISDTSHAEAQSISEEFAGQPNPNPDAGPTSELSPGQEATPIEPIRNFEEKVGRNDLCPCGSGKKYKKCHGANA